MVQTRGQKAAAGGNAAPQQAQQNQPAPQAQPQPTRGAGKGKPRAGKKKKTQPVDVTDDEEDQPAPQRGAGKRKPRGGKKKKKKKNKPADDSDAEEDQPEQETADDAPAESSKRKRPTPVASASGSQAPGSGAPGPSKRAKTARPELPTLDENDDVNDAEEGPAKSGRAEVSGAGAQAVHKSKGKGKGKAAVKADDSPEIPRPVGYVSANHSDGGQKTQNEMKKDKAKIRRDWSLGNKPDFDSNTWKGGKELGAGAYGAAYVYYCEDSNGMITDRIVVKDTCIGTRHQWRDWVRWWGDPRDPEEREHMEIKIMNDMATKARDGRCIEIRGSSLYDDILTYRIIMNYCPLGPLYDATPDVLVDKKSRLVEVYDDDFDIPEPLVWKWLEDLAKACLLMEEGQDLAEDKRARQKCRHVIVHRDIKPGNVFLDLASNERGDWPTYPIATLGDFGCSIYTCDADVDNPMSYNYWEGTKGFRPLEMSSVLDVKTLRAMNMGKLGSATNIWGIGASIMSLINRDHSPDIDYRSPEKSVPRFTVNAQHYYSNELRGLLLKCVEYLPANRISAQDLLDQISNYTAGKGADEEDHDFALGMRAGQPTTTEVQTAWDPPVKEYYERMSTVEAGDQSREEQEKKHKAEDQRKRDEYKKKKKEADAVARKEAAAAKNAAKAAKREAAQAAAKKKKKGKK